MKDISSNGILSSYDLPDSEFDERLETTLTRRHTKETLGSPDIYTILPTSTDFDFLDDECRYYPVSFRIGKGKGKMFPLDIHHEDTLRGHLMMTLLSTTILKILQDRLLKTKLSTSEVFSVLSHQGALVYPDSLITSEPVKKMNDIYKHFNLKCPEEIPYTPTGDEYARM